MKPLVALLTDFGLQDHYVGAVKGAVLAACREATVVDVVHELPAHDIAEGAYALASCFRAFPGGTVFVAIVDPGVGAQRRGLALEAGGYLFVGPDNGIFSLVLAEFPEARVHELTNAGLFRHEVSATFHGRDVFAPVAGRLAGGMPLEEVGPPVQDPIVVPAEAALQRSETEWEGRVVHVDRFGNLTSSITTADIRRVLAAFDDDPTSVVVVVEGIVLPFVRTYAEVPEGEACALLGSSGRLEVAINQGNAARQLGATRGAPVLLRTVGSVGDGPVL
jgi:S-adenosylmethionine hydrolase